MLEVKTYKNYKKICEAMGWKVKGGNAKQSQLKDLERYCKYDKEGNKFIVTEIYNSPLPKVENRGRSGKYNDYLEKLLINMLSSCPIDNNTKAMNVCRNGLYLQLHLINKNYSIGRVNMNKLSRKLKVPIDSVYDFYNSTNKKLSSNVERALNRLQNQCLIKWEYRHTVRIKNSGYRLATEEEMNLIVQAERDVLLEMGETDKRSLFLHGKWNTFQKEVNCIIKECTDIIYYYKSFHIYTTKDFREMLLDSEDLTSIQDEVNDIMYLSSIETAINRNKNVVEKYSGVNKNGSTYCNNPRYENEMVAIRDEYIDDIKKIANVVLDWAACDLELLKISSDAYTLMDYIMKDDDEDFDIALITEF